MSLPAPLALHAAYGQELAELLEQVLAGDLVKDRPAGERLVRSLGALVLLQERHGVDEGARCLFCRAARRGWRWLWPKRTTCTVHSALGFFLRQPEWVVLSVIADSPSHIRERRERHL